MTEQPFDLGPQQDALNALASIRRQDNGPRKWTPEDLMNASFIFANIAQSLAWQYQEEIDMPYAERPTTMLIFAQGLKQLVQDFTGL